MTATEQALQAATARTQAVLTLFSDLEFLKQKTYALATSLGPAKKVVAEAAKALAAAHGIAKEFRERLLPVVAEERTEDGSNKLRFPNEATRKAEVERRLPQDPHYLKAVAEVEKAEVQLLNAQLAQGKIEDDHRAHLWVVRMTLAEARLLGSI